MHRFINSEDVLGTVTSGQDDYDFIIASGAWGDAFLGQFFNLVKRNHDLCRSKINERFEYVFYTTKADYEKYKEKFDPDMTFLFMDNHPHPGGMNGAQIDYASRRQLPVILMAVDCFHTPNLIPNLRSSKYDNNDAVCVMSQRIYKEVLDAIRERETQIPYEDIFQPREFLKLCLPNLHVRERRYFMDSYRLTGTYGSMMYPVRKDGVLVGELIRSFHLGYIYLKKPVVGLSSGFLDSNGFVGNLTTPETIGMVTDSDDGFCVDVNGDQNDFGNDPTPLLEDMSQITRCYQGWIRQAVYPVNESLMGYNIAVHSEPLDHEWIELSKKADDFVTDIYGGSIKNKPLTWRMLE